MILHRNRRVPGELVDCRMHEVFPLAVAVEVEAIAILRQASLGLAFLHSLGIVPWKQSGWRLLALKHFGYVA